MALNQLEDRCDATTRVVDVSGQAMTNSCGAEALVRVENVQFGALDFCAHHFGVNRAELENQGFVVIEDNTAKLTAHNRLVGSDH